MEAIELRIGNLISYAGRIGEVLSLDSEEGIYFDGLDSSHLNGLYVDGFEGIPLTEEWLLKFGFEKREDTWYDLGQISVSFTLERMIYITYDFQENEIYHELPFKEFVHDFQNLVYALTNEELKIKLMKIEEYKDEKNEHRIRLTSDNGNIIYASTEGYKNAEDARQAAIKSSLAIIYKYDDCLEFEDLMLMKNIVNDWL